MRERTPFTRKVIEGLPDMKLLITTGARNNSIDVKAAAERGVTVCGTGGFGIRRASIAVGLMLELTRHIGFENARLKAGAPWQVTIGRDLDGLTLGVLGLGKLGQRSATVGKALRHEGRSPGARISPKKRPRRRAPTTFPRRTCSAMRILSPSMWCSATGRAAWSARNELGLMKKTAYLINTSRGPIVDEKALSRRFRTRRSPAPASTCSTSSLCRSIIRFRKMDNVVLTPHLGYVSEQNYRKYFPDVVEDIRAWLDGKPVRVIEAK